MFAFESLRVTFEAAVEMGNKELELKLFDGLLRDAAQLQRENEELKGKQNRPSGPGYFTR